VKETERKRPYPSGGTKQMAARSLTVSSIDGGSLGSIDRAKMVNASSWLMIAIRPYCNDEMKVKDITGK
jgi:hypothetical protein